MCANPRRPLFSSKRGQKAKKFYHRIPAPRAKPMIWQKIQSAVRIRSHFLKPNRSRAPRAPARMCTRPLPRSRRFCNRGRTPVRRQGTNFFRWQIPTCSLRLRNETGSASAPAGCLMRRLSRYPLGSILIAGRGASSVSRPKNYKIGPSGRRGATQWINMGCLVIIGSATAR